MGYLLGKGLILSQERPPFADYVKVEQIVHTPQLNKIHFELRSLKRKISSLEKRKAELREILGS